MMNKYRKALSRISRDLPAGMEWSDDDREHLETVLEALEQAAERAEKEEQNEKHQQN